MGKNTQPPKVVEAPPDASPAVVVPTRADLDQSLSQLPGENTDTEYVVRSMRSHFGDVFTDADEKTVRDAFAAPVPGALIKARVLTACGYGKPDDVVEVSSQEAGASPDLDAHPDAVAYAESLTA